MSRPTDSPPRPQQALQSYLDGLLQEATEPAAEEAEAPVAAVAQPVVEPASAPADEFEAAVREEQTRDAGRANTAPAPLARATSVASEVKPLAQAEPFAALERPNLWVGPSVLPQAPVEVDAELPAPVGPAVTPEPAPEESITQSAQVGTPVGHGGGPAAPTKSGRPAWGEEPFECLLFDVAGLTLAVPLVCLGSIYPLAGQELTPLFGQPEWFLGLLPSHNGNLKVLDTARWVMPDRYRDDFQQGLQYVISVQGYEWGLAVHAVNRSLRLDPAEIKWRSQGGQRPWLAGTVIEHMCALVDVAQLAEMIASGAVKEQDAATRAKAAADAKAKAEAAKGRKR